MGGIARTNNMKALAVGGIADHSHILLSIPPTITIAKAMQLVKAGSSGWIHEQTGSQRFEWQEGYGKRFGLIHVDHRTQRRTIKDSGYWVRDMIQNQQIQNSY